VEGLWKTHAPSDLPVYPEVPYAFFGFHPGLPRTFHLLDVRYPQVYRTQPLGALRKLTGDYVHVNGKIIRLAWQIFVGLTEPASADMGGS
jgi:hypothetical protein